jgi:hypothetical protein
VLPAALVTKHTVYLLPPLVLQHDALFSVPLSLSLSLPSFFTHLFGGLAPCSVVEARLVHASHELMQQVNPLLWV